MTDSLTLFQQLLTDAWDTQMQLDPLYATMCGDRRYNDRLPEVGEAAAERQRQAYRAFWPAWRISRAASCRTANRSITTCSATCCAANWRCSRPGCTA